MRNLLMKVLQIRGRRLAIVAAVAALILGGGVGVAAAATTAHSGTSITRVSIATSGDAVIYTSTAWTNVGTTYVYAMAGQTIDARFTTESACYGTSGWCSVRIVIDGIEAEPAVGTDFAFNSLGSSSGWESLSVERVLTAPSTATHTVTVQAAAVGANSDRLDDWLLRADVVTP